jgi:hypothetical protein
MLHKDLSLIHVHRDLAQQEPSDKGLTAWDKDYLIDEKHNFEDLTPPVPFDEGLTAWDKNYITDAQSGPFYPDFGKAPFEPKNSTDTTITSDPSSTRHAVTAGLGALVALIAILLFIVASGGAAVKTMLFTFWSHAISVFCALVIVVALKDLAAYLFYATYAPGSRLLPTIVILLLIMAVSHSLMFTLRSRPIAQLSVGALGLYGISFAAIEIFEILEHLEYFQRADLVGVVGTFIVSYLIIAIFLMLCTSYRSLVETSCKNSDVCRNGCCARFCFHWADLESVNAPSWNEWKKQAVRCDDQVAALTYGYLISQAIEFSILRANPSESITFNWYMLMLAVAVLLMLSLCFGALTRGGSDGAQSSRFNPIMLNTLLTASAWCLFHATQWQFNGGFVNKSLGLVPKSFTASLLIALTMSLIVLFLFLATCLYAWSLLATPWDNTLHRNFQAVVFALGFVLGLAWVTCFLDSLPAFAMDFPKINIPPTLPAAIIVSLGVIVPWALFVVPRTVGDDKSQ